jgi:hypothetical protein
MRSRLTVWAAIFASAAAAATTEEAARKVLSARCWACHAQTATAGIRLDSREGIAKVKSRLSHVLASGKMPPGTPLPAAERDALQRWIADGAPWTGPSAHWSFAPLPPIRPGDTIDSLLDAAQRARGIQPNSRADRRTLIRRLSFDLIGLPPEETDEPVPQIVDRLLASPHFGEKWGRHWLDVARFGEDDFTGTEVVPYANAWRYRDWVVQAINRDMPYDRFLMAQLAGDLMKDDSLLPATGLLGLGPWYYGIAQPAQSRADERHDRIDMVTRGMLGVTVACARCHDHKYDPFTQQDYYALAGVFSSTAYKEYPLVSPAEAEAWTRQKNGLTTAEKTLNTFLDEHSSRLAGKFAHRIADYLTEAGEDLHPKIIERWKKEPRRTRAEAEAFQKMVLEIVAEKKAIDEENKRLVAAAKAKAPKVLRTVVLPGGYRSEEDFNPGADIPAKSLERERFVTWNKVFGEKTSPLKLDRELTADLLEPEYRGEYQRLKADVDSRKKALPPQYPYLHGAGEFEPHDRPLEIRGNPELLGGLVPRRFPLAFSGGKPLFLNQGSGRLQLANLVAHHPLAARVAANRIWLALLGQGLVRTPSNFGTAGDRPAVPELLDYLAARLTQERYSIKALIREIVLSDAYQRSSDAVAANEKLDGENRLLWRQNRRRLSAEALLDSMLAVTGELDRSLGGESKPLTADFNRRAIYAKTGRFQSDETMALFDLPSALVTCEQRVVTNVPLQKLFFLNSEFVTKRAAAMARRVNNIEDAYGVVFQRAPTERERQLGRDFLDSADWPQYAWVLLSSNEFAYVD